MVVAVVAVVAQAQASPMGQGNTQGQSSGMDGFQWAWLETLQALSAVHVAELAEAQVSHWVMEGRASLSDLMDARARVKQARIARGIVRRRYLRCSMLAAESAGNAAGTLARRGW